jgi:hypothetical protein
MRRLVPGGPVALAQGDVELRGRVVAVADDTALVLPVRDGRAGPSLEPQAAVDLRFEHRGTPVALHGRAVLDPSGCVAFTALGDGQLRNLRHTTRVGLRVPVTLTPADARWAPAGAPVRTATVDLSAGGLLAAADAGAPGAALLLGLELAAGSVTPLRAHVVRRAPRRTAVAFCDVAPVVRAELEVTIGALRRALRARPASRPL